MKIGIATLPLLLSLSGCTWLSSHPAVVPDLQAVEACAEKVLLTDTSAGDTAVTIGIDLASNCGTDVGKVLADLLAKDASKFKPSSKGTMVLSAQKK